MRPGSEYFLQPERRGATPLRGAARLLRRGVPPPPRWPTGSGTPPPRCIRWPPCCAPAKLDPLRRAKPGPKGPRKATGEVRDKVLALRAEDRSISEIAEALAAAGTPISAQTVWQILDDAGACPGWPAATRAAAAPRRGWSRSRRPPCRGWPAAAQIPCDHAGLLLLFPAMASSACPNWSPQAGYPSTSALTAWQSIGTLLLAKCARRHRAHHIDALDRRHRPGVRSAADRAAQGHPRRLLLLPGAPRIQHQTAHRPGQGAAPTRTGQRRRPDSTSTSTPSATTASDTALEKHYVPRRSQRTRAVLTFFAQDHASTEMVYANAEITKAEQAREIIAFADYWHHATGEDPGLLVLRLPTDHLQGARRTHRPRHPLADPAPTRQNRTRPPRRATRLAVEDRHHRPLRPLPAPPTTRRHDHTQRHRHQGPPDRHPQHRPRRTHPADHQRPHHPRQGPVRPLRRTHDHRKRTRRLHLRLPPRRALQRRPAQRRPRHHPHRLAGNLYRLLARDLPRYQTATPDTIWRHFLDDPGTLHISDHGVTCALNLRSHHPLLIDAGYADLKIPIPWWNNRTLHFTLPTHDEPPTTRTTSTQFPHRESRLNACGVPVRRARVPAQRVEAGSPQKGQTTPGWNPWTLGQGARQTLMSLGPRGPGRADRDPVRDMPQPVGGKVTTAHTVLRGDGPYVTPHRAASVATSSRPRPDSASAGGHWGSAVSGARSLRVSVTSIRRATGSSVVWTLSRKLRPGTLPCSAALEASSPTT